MSEIVVALTTLPADFDVLALARDLVAEKVAACVTIFPPVQSVYEWQDSMTVDREQQVLMKTTRTRVPNLWEALRRRHPYETPEFLVLPVVDGNPAYLKWVENGSATASRGVRRPRAATPRGSRPLRSRSRPRR